MNEKVKDIMAKFRDGVANIQTTQEWKELLDFMARFHKYSFTNSLLIHMQYPYASFVAGFRKWNEMGRLVKKGAKGIKILIPRFKKGFKKMEDDDGEEVPKLIGFLVGHVFDVSQTEGETLPTVIEGLSGRRSDITDALLGALEMACDVPVVYDQTGSAKGWYNPIEHRITLNSALEGDQKVKTWIHEWAHARLHRGADAKDKRHEEKEAEAEGIAYVVCKYFGLDTSEYSFPYVRSWIGRNPKLLERVGNTIQREAARIIKLLSPILGLEEKEVEKDEEEEGL